MRRVGATNLFVGLAVFLFAAILAGLSLGTAGVLAPWRAVSAVLIGSFDGAGELDVTERIAYVLRFPRVLLGLIAGYALAVSGVVMQGVFRNPLADPYLLGIAGGATVGAALVFTLGLGEGGLSAAGGAFLGGTITVWVVYRLSLTRLGRLSDFSLVLSGVAIASFAGAMTSFLVFMADHEDLRRIIFFMLGSLTRAELTLDLLYLAIILVIGIVGLQLFARDLNALALGDETAMHLGVDPLRAKRRLLLLASLVTSSVVAYAGVIGFVGLIVPHAVRLLVGPDHRRLLLVSGLAGAAFLVICDTTARTAIPTADIPVGVVTSFIGAPFLIVLLRRRRPGREVG